MRFIHSFENCWRFWYSKLDTEEPFEITTSPTSTYLHVLSPWPPKSQLFACNLSLLVQSSEDRGGLPRAAHRQLHGMHRLFFLFGEGFLFLGSLPSDEQDFCIMKDEASLHQNLRNHKTSSVRWLNNKYNYATTAGQENTGMKNLIWCLLFHVE